MNSTQHPSQSKQLPANQMTRTKLRFKPSKNVRQRQERQQPLFNDPLYQHLDNQVFNREQHNFGPWVEMDRRSRQRTRQRRAQINVITDLPGLYQDRPHVQSSIELTQAPNNFQEQLQSHNINLPNIRERNSRASSLQELRGVSIQLNPYEGKEEPRFRHEYSLARQPFFLRAPGSYRLGANSGEFVIKRSNVIYNYCLRQQEEKIVNTKLKMKPEQSYLKLQNANKATGKQQFSNKDLMRQLKQYRINKFK